MSLDAVRFFFGIPEIPGLPVDGGGGLCVAHHADPAGKLVLRQPVHHGPQGHRGGLG